MDRSELARLYDFTDRVIAVTGGAGALGSEMVAALAGCGASVAILDYAAEPGQRLAAHINESAGAGPALFVQSNVLDRASLVAAEEQIRRQLGPVDTLINAAGGNHPSATTGPYGQGSEPEPSFFDLTEAGVRAVFDLNFLGTLLPCQIFSRGMVERGEGVILNVSSMNAFRPLTRIPAYSAAKAAVSNFTQWLAVYMAQNHSERIRVNALAPGFFVTEQSCFLAIDPSTGQLSPPRPDSGLPYAHAALW